MYAWFIRTGFEKRDEFSSWSPVAALAPLQLHHKPARDGRATHKVPISRLNLDEYNLLTVHT
ncbi:hypothetical protein [Bordetella pertussis]|uniref:hypothetical protein n=1 Tax=Bordetella pertussis TaxID=520 RepID=UPI0009B0C16C|nr:hypothetical protein [Bordetella pertussis]